MESVIGFCIVVGIATLYVLGYWLYLHIDYNRFCNKLHEEYLRNRAIRERQMEAYESACIKAAILHDRLIEEEE